MSNHRACAIIKRRSIRVVFQEGQAIKKERTRFRKQKRDDPCAWRGEGYPTVQKLSQPLLFNASS